jgi:hypothetical protein
MAWGNLTGIRVDGHLFELNSSMCVAQPDGSVFTTGREKQNNTYSRDGKVETVGVQMRGHGWALNGRETVEETGAGSAKVEIQYDSPQEADIAGAWWCLDLPAALFSGGTVQLVGAVKPAPEKVSLAPGRKDQNEYVRGTANGLHLTAGRREDIEIDFGDPTEVVIRDDRRKGNYDIQVMMEVLTGKAAAGQKAGKSFTVKVAGEVDHNPVTVALDAAHPGQLFDGMGGNFRLQNPNADPGIIDYNLKNLRVAWGRVEMPWRIWQPDENSDPLAAARAGTLNPRVQQAMEMARRLGAKGMPVIVSAWFPPPWAVLGMSGRGGPQAEGPRGYPLNPQKMDQIKKSIADYLVFLKEKFGVEAAMFTFNESDLGIDVRQTAREHDEMIKTFGPYFASRGLATRLALGDTSDATPVDFIQPALHDPEAAPYIAAVDFHSWRGCTDEILGQWSAAARQLNVPLIVAEGSTDAAA